ncbi:MAG TPA: hypothetical protein VF136_09265 [Methylomirabilota bacterium]
MGAPSSLLAAPPNQLSEPGASPMTGGTLTTFVLSVRYTSTGGNPAQAVVAEVGPLSVGLSLVSGSATDGVWRGVSLLPAGTWQVTFRAEVDNGPQPTLAGPTLTVAAAPGPTPTPSSPNVRPVPTEAQPTATPALNPQATPASTSPSPDAGPAGSAEASSAASERPAPKGEPSAPSPARSADSRPVTAATAAPGGEGTNTDPSPDSGEGPADGAPLGSTGGSPRASDTPAGLLEGDPGGPGSGDLLLVLGVVLGVATVALLGTGWMLAARSRDDEPEPAAASTGQGRRPAAATGRAAEIEERRARRRAQRLPGHDPVLAALGLDADDEADAGLAPRRGTARGATPTSRPTSRR